uniref:Sphingomyelin phosphodiesterase 2 n=2 Tax=Geospiza parvula TaxID=87175 RepID=A0A8U8BPS7_GEOPR
HGGRAHPAPPIFNLNCWAIRYLSKRRQQRVRLIGDTLRQEGFDLVLLQEVWSEQDYSELKVKLAGCYPFSHYFRSGVIGSGLCVFSRFPILDTLLYQYSLNGYPYMLQHGDWFCGKSVGLVVMKISGIIFNVYVTHLHAEYCRDKDAYLPHRLVQAWELAQFIRHTSKAADVVLLGGDLNMHPDDVGIRLLRGWTGLQDAFAEAMHFEGCKNGCTLVPDNCFIDKSELLPFPLGIRIDYILYKAISSFTVKCEELKTTTGRAPGMDIPFSDHEAVMATLHIQRQGQPAGATLGTAGKSGAAASIRSVLGGWWMDWWGWMELFGDVSPCGGLQSGGDGEKAVGVVWGGYRDGMWGSHPADGPCPRRPSPGRCGDRGTGRGGRGAAGGAAAALLLGQDGRAGPAAAAAPGCSCPGHSGRAGRRAALPQALLLPAGLPRPRRPRPRHRSPPVPHHGGEDAARHRGPDVDGAEGPAGASQ